MRIYKHSSLPALGAEQEREVVDEFRRLERWGLEVNYALEQRPPFAGVCPEDNGAIPYMDCDSGSYLPSSLTYVPDPSAQPGVPAIHVGSDLLLPHDNVISFANQADDQVLGGIGNLAAKPDWLLMVATADPDQWENVATRRPLGMGGSSVILDAGTSMALRLPGIEPLTEGYDLQISSDGESLIAVPNPPPDWSAIDTSSDTGTVLISGTAVQPWARFPDGVGNQPEALTVLVPSGTLAGTLVIRVIVRVANNTSHSGMLNLGIGVGAAEPASGDWDAFPIPAGYSGNIVASMIRELAADLTADEFLRVWFSGQGDHTNFSLETDTTNGDHQLDVSITYGGGSGSPGVTDHQLLTNRDPASGSAHMASSVSVDPTPMTYVSGDDVQAGMEQLDAAVGSLAGNVPVIGMGGVGYAASAYTISAAGGNWITINPSGSTLFTGSTNVQLIGGELRAVGSPRRVSLHAQLYGKDNPPTGGVRLRFLRNGVTILGGVADTTPAYRADGAYYLDAALSTVDCDPGTNPIYAIQIRDALALDVDVATFSFWLTFD